MVAGSSFAARRVEPLDVHGRVSRACRCFAVRALLRRTRRRRRRTARRAASTLWGRAVASFRRAIDEGEAEAHGARRVRDDASRLRALITRKLAEAVAEQRLLWHLRQEIARRRSCIRTRSSRQRRLTIARAEFRGRLRAAPALAGH